MSISIAFLPQDFTPPLSNNSFMQDLRARSARQIAFSTEAVGHHDTMLSIGVRRREVFVSQEDFELAEAGVMLATPRHCARGLHAGFRDA